ncbi:MAG: enoyl-CoA hydratase/isomerase family protein [Alphaproteobacteria bacterium]|nr:enoyl-CoA hydratase/isomerase family protein [Alphaproteobacteria bacterium]
MIAVNDVTALSREGEVAVITINSPPVNALSAKVRDGLAEAFRRAIEDPDVNAIVLTCEGRTFIAGADIAEFGKPPQGISLPDLGNLIESSPKPVVAAIHGTALGGGLEVALCAHYRVAVQSAKCGFPEVNLGLLPGAGGTQRGTRLLGVEAALDMITSGRPLPAAKCRELGLIDPLAPEGELREAAIAFARDLIAQNKPLRKVRDSDEKIAPARAHPEIFENFRKENARKFRGLLAPEYCIRAVEAAVNMPFDEGMKVERRLFEELRDGPQSKALRYVFFAEREVWKIPDLPPGTPTIPVNTVGIIGAGTMGGGIAMNFLNAGMPVTIVETKQDGLDRGLSTIRRNYESAAKKGRMTAAEVETRMALLTGTLSLDDLANCDLVVEAVFENMDVKKDVFRKLDAIAKPGAILATNTSYLNIDEMAAVTTRPDCVIGLHFFSPANIMKLLEVVRAKETSKAVIATAMQLAKRIGKIGVLVQVGYGFVGNRMLAQRQREADALVLEGAAPWDVDRVLVEFGFPMGPFQMRDLAGLDLGWSRETSKSATIREVLCEMDRRGQKTNAGYYDYDENRKAKPSATVERLVEDFRAKSGVQTRRISDDEILERCLYPMINEGAKILEEGIAIGASDIDVVWINGYGWPRYRGGPMYYAGEIGLEKVLDNMRAWQAERGDAFKPAALLEKLVADGKTFRDVK